MKNIILSLPSSSRYIYFLFLFGNIELNNFNVSSPHYAGHPITIFSSIMGHEKIVEFLLENGADVNSVASSEVSAMWLAASEGRVDVMKILAKNNADASNTRVDGISALMTAAVS
jgi:ankyrin repeat protein